jgi:predicted transposase YdaD
MSKYINLNTEEYQEGLLSYIEVKEVAKTAEVDGRKKEKNSIAQKLKLMGLSKEQIKEATGLSDGDIEGL